MIFRSPWNWNKKDWSSSLSRVHYSIHCSCRTWSHFLFFTISTFWVWSERKISRKLLAISNEIFMQVSEITEKLWRFLVFRRSLSKWCRLFYISATWENTFTLFYVFRILLLHIFEHFGDIFIFTIQVLRSYKNLEGIILRLILAILVWKDEHEEEYRDENRSELLISSQAILFEDIQLIYSMKIVKMILKRSI